MNKICVLSNNPNSPLKKFMCNECKDSDKKKIRKKLGSRK